MALSPGVFHVHGGRLRVRVRKGSVAMFESARPLRDEFAALEAALSDPAVHSERRGHGIRLLRGIVRLGLMTGRKCADEQLEVAS